MSEKVTGILLAAGSGKRMNSAVKKQYMEIWGKPVLYYALKTMQETGFLTDIVLVCGEEDRSFVARLIEEQGFDKVTAIVNGGAERYLSVLEGLKAAKGSKYVFIHDGARPMLNREMMEKLYAEVKVSGCCAMAVPAKDTIRMLHSDGRTENLPRKKLWQMQTPQVLSYDLIMDAYERVLGTPKEADITDDVMLVELAFEKSPVLVMGDYRNIKITTPEDLELAELYLKVR